MKTAHKFLLIMVVMVFVPVFAVWYTAWPLITAWNLPEIQKAHMIVPTPSDLSEKQVEALNQWLYKYRTGWGTMGEKPPESKENIQLILEYNEDLSKKNFALFFWHFKHGDDVVAIKLGTNGSYRMRSLDVKESTYFKKILSQ